jgi:hypothetical protein
MPITKLKYWSPMATWRPEISRPGIDTGRWAGEPLISGTIHAGSVGLFLKYPYRFWGPSFLFFSGYSFFI